MQANTTSSQPKKLLNQVRDTLRVKHDNIRTEQTYLNWIKRYIFFHDKLHLKNRGAESFLMHLAKRSANRNDDELPLKQMAIFLELLCIE